MLMPSDLARMMEMSGRCIQELPCQENHASPFNSFCSSRSDPMSGCESGETNHNLAANGVFPSARHVRLHAIEPDELQAVTTAVALEFGLGSSLFAVALCFTVITMYDAAGVRRHAGKESGHLSCMTVKVPMQS